VKRWLAKSERDERLRCTIMNEAPFGESARRHLESLCEHPNAPKFNFSSTDLLDRRRLAEVEQFAQVDRIFWAEGKVPEWVYELVRRAFRIVPYYREMGDPPTDLQAIPPISRAELAEHPELLVPDDLGLEELTVYTTSGTTGTALKIPTDPAVSSKTLVLMEQLMSLHGTRFPRGPGQVAVAALFYQDQTLTYPSLSHYLDGAATLKLNLHEDCWRQAQDRVEFLRAMSPAVVTGCPLSLQVAAEIAPELQPLAIFSSATPLSDGLREQLTETFDCPIFDVYSLTEAKFIAARGQGEGHDLLAPDLYVEILDDEGRLVPAGERGEITVTGGRNKYLPLIRYRTGDYASLEYRGYQPYLCGLQGRCDATLVDGQGRSIPSLDVVNTLRELPLIGFSFKQDRDGNYLLEYCGEVSPDEVKRVLKNGLDLSGKVTQTQAWRGKPHQFL
jgi:phenylacetate-coenzyme A ligase PaaK-like adenylate-forming protein